MAVQAWQFTPDGQVFWPSLKPGDERALGWAVLVVTDDRGGVLARASVDVDPSGRPVVTDVRIECGQGLTSSDLRAVSLTALLAVVQSEVSTLRDPRWRAITGTDARIGQLVESAPDQRRRPARRIPDATLRKVAELYLDEQTGGPGLHRRILRRLRMLPTEDATIRRWIQRARRDGWLSPAQHGARGAVAGPRLIAAREQEGDHA